MKTHSTTLSILALFCVGCLVWQPALPTRPVALPEGFPETIEFFGKEPQLNDEEQWVFLVPDNTTKDQLTRLMEAMAEDDPVCLTFGFLRRHKQVVYILRRSDKEYSGALFAANTVDEYGAAREALAATFLSLWSDEFPALGSLGYIGYPSYSDRELVVQVNLEDLFAP